MLGTALRRRLGALQYRLCSWYGCAGKDGQFLEPATTTTIAEPSAGGCSRRFTLGRERCGASMTAAYKRELTASRVDSTHALAMILLACAAATDVGVASAVGIYGDRGCSLG